MAEEEKLKYFYDSTMSALETVKANELLSMKEKLEQDLEEYKKQHSKEIARQESLHEAEIRRELLKDLASEKLRIRREQSRKEAKLIDKLFEEAGEKLDEFRRSSQYRETLKDCIQKIVEFAGDDEVVIYLCADDADLKDGLEAECGIPLSVSDMHFNGGVQAEIPGRNIFINNSFSSEMIERKRAYVLKV